MAKGKNAILSLEEVIKTCSAYDFGLQHDTGLYLIALQSELNKLRGWIENAGHNKDCQLVLYEYDKVFKCTCGLSALLDTSPKQKDTE